MERIQPSRKFTTKDADDHIDDLLENVDEFTPIEFYQMVQRYARTFKNMHGLQKE